MPRLERECALEMDERFVRQPRLEQPCPEVRFEVGIVRPQAERLSIVLDRAIALRFRHVQVCEVVVCVGVIGIERERDLERGDRFVAAPERRERERAGRERVRERGIGRDDGVAVRERLRSIARLAQRGRETQARLRKSRARARWNSEALRAAARGRCAYAEVRQRRVRRGGERPVHEGCGAAATIELRRAAHAPRAQRIHPRRRPRPRTASAPPACSGAREDEERDARDREQRGAQST
jgi:hypothetical protein